MKRLILVVLCAITFGIRGVGAEVADQRDSGQLRSHVHAEP